MAHAQNCFCSECRGDPVSEPKQACHAPITCARCGTFHGDCDLLRLRVGESDFEGVGAQRAGAEPPHHPFNGVKDGTPMAKQRQMPKPQGRNKANGYNGGTLPEPEGGGGFDGNPYFKPDMLGKSGKGKITFLGKVRDAGPNSFQDLQAEISFNKKKYDFGIKFKSGNYRILYERFGKNPAKWKGTVNVEVDEYLGNQYTKIVD